MQQHNNPSTGSGIGGGLIAALIAFALTWFVVNGSAPHEAQGATATTEPYSICMVSENIPTSRFFKTPVTTPIPLQGG
ncbi:MAG: hypothetical protein IPG43_21350 [Proteobacteria bacterium]|nr:hypothetical protein [Pseudomonadota bacterium]